MLTMVMSRDPRGYVRFHPTWNADSAPITALVPAFRKRCEEEGNTYLQSWILPFSEPLQSLSELLHNRLGASYRMLCAAIFSQGYHMGFKREALPRQPPPLGSDFEQIRQRLGSCDDRAELLLATIFALGFARGAYDAPPTNN